MKPTSPLAGVVREGDQISRVDATDTLALDHKQLSALLVERAREPTRSLEIVADAVSPREPVLVAPAKLGVKVRRPRNGSKDTRRRRLPSKEPFESSDGAETSDFAPRSRRGRRQWEDSGDDETSETAGARRLVG